MKNILKLSCLVFLFVAGSCGITDLEENLENPNEVGVGNLDVNLLMNKIQLDFGDFVAEANVPSMELSRMVAMTGGDVYERAYQPQTHNDIWNRAYQDVLIQIETLLSRTDGTGLTVHSGSARVLKAYVMLTLVDLFNDVPYSQALQGSLGAEGFNPGTDSGQSIYAAAITILDEAIALLGQTATGSLSRDIYFGGSAAKWAALANTLKLKAYLNLRLTDAGAKAKIEELLGKDLVDTDAEEFTYKYATSDVPARSRHPLYRQMYQPGTGGNADGYLSNYYMLVSYKQKGVEDPRWRYYFYRQVGSIATALADEPESIPCIISPRPSHYGPNQAWCAFDPGFFGRDHGNNDGIPPDGRALTCFGVYPAGGRVDVNPDDPIYQGLAIQGQGANGAGIEPIWMAGYTEFLKAEAALTLGTTGDAKALMLSGVNKSIARVRAFGAAKGQTVPAALEPSIMDYTDAVAALYDAAANDDERLGVIMKEYYIALWGNGIEAYNMYRRTGKPSDMQPTRAANPGNFVRSLIYPANYVNLNSSATQKNIAGVNKVFWDNNPDNFVY
jgi:hypothetical protein